MMKKIFFLLKFFRTIQKVLINFHRFHQLKSFTNISTKKFFQVEKLFLNSKSSL